jgi:iron complex outermembrane receptor protein
VNFKFNILLSCVGIFCYSYAFSQETAKIIVGDSLQDAVDLKTIVISTSFEKSNNAPCHTLPSQNTDDAVEQMQGAHLIRRGNYAAEPTFRGMSSGQISVTIDGMKIFGACTDKMDPVSSYVSSNNLQSISLSSNSAHAGHGSNVGGGFDFVTKQPQMNSKKSINGEAGLGYESNGNGRKASFNLNYGDSAFAINLNGNYQKYDNYTAGGGKEILYSQFEKVNFALSGSWMLSPTQIVKAQLIYDDAFNVGYPALPMDVSYAGGRIYSLSYQKYFRKGSILYKAYGNNITHIMDDTKRAFVPMHMDMPGYSNTYGFFAKADYSIGKKHRITINPDYYHNTSFADMTMYPNDPSRPEEPPMYMITWPDVRRNSGSFLVSDQFKISSKSTLNLTGKLEFVTSSVFSEFGQQQLSILDIDGTVPYSYFLTNGDANYTYTLSKKWNLSGQFGYAERQPTVSEGFGYYLFNSMDGYDYIGMPTLKKERAMKFNLGTQFTMNKTFIEGQVYHYQFQDYIIGIVEPEFDGMTIGANGVKVYSNIPNATISGMELVFRTTILKLLKVENSTQYSYGLDNEGVPLQMIPPLQNTLKLNAEINQWNYRFETIIAAAQNNPRSIAGETATPSYGIINLYAQREFSLLKQKWGASLGIKNLLDSYYWNHLDWNTIPRPGRSFVATLHMKF